MSERPPKFSVVFGPGMDEAGTVNYALPPRGRAFGRPAAGLRNYDCRKDGHEDPDLTGSCIHCDANTLWRRG